MTRPGPTPGGKWRAARDDDPETSSGEDPIDKLLGFLAEKISPDDMARVTDIISEIDGYSMAADSIISNRSLGAMDYSTRQAVKEFSAIQNAREEVRTVVGDIPAMDSASGVYLAALQQMGHDTKDLHPSAAKPMFRAWRRSHGSTRPNRPIGMDAKQEAEIAERFPGIAKLKRR